jgi:DNA invertase Pin-like site-specific DNA recombinase
MTNTYIANTRVSTQKQGAESVSLKEQRRTIERYAKQRHLKIVRWYEEQATAARRGRPVFRETLKGLEEDRGRTGLLLHKIDRGTRNLRDWADSET